MLQNQEQIFSYIKKIVKQKMPHNKYHNYKHAIEVYDAVSVYGVLEKVKPRDLFLLKISALLHDVVYVDKRKDNEEQSSLVAEELLVFLDFNKRDISLVKKLILATKIPVHPRTKLEKIICDADVSNVGTDSFFKKTEALRKDFKLNKKTYYSINLKNFINHLKFHTKSANKILKKKFTKNKKKVLKIIKSYSKN